MGISAHDREIQLLVNDVKDSHLQLPVLQRKYVWKSTQVRDFFDSLYHQYPTGQLLVWETDDLSYAHNLSAAGIGQSSHRPQLLLDGQQRLTSLYAVMTGENLVAKDKSNDKTIDIVFNAFSEKFEVATAFYRPQSGWISVTKLFTQGLLPVFNELKLDYSSDEAQQALANLSRLDGIKSYRYRVTVLEGLTYSEVTNIFLRINSGGTRLGNADLALAQISSRWREVSQALDAFQRRAKSLGWELDETILLRVLAAILTRRATLGELFKAGRRDELTEGRLRDAWDRAQPAMEQAIHFIKQNCLIDRPSILPTNYVLVPLAAFFDRHRDGVTQKQARDLQRWLYMALIWARYSASSETNLDQDLAALDTAEPIARMIQNIEDKVGPRRLVTERELQDQLSNSPFMVMAYVLAKRNQAQDWFSGVAIGEGQKLEYHLIFPKSVLGDRYQQRQNSRLINQVANLAFLTAKAAIKINAKSPSEYLADIPASRLRAQLVPQDQVLWSPAHFEDFLLERRQMLADAINSLLRSLSGDQSLWSPNDAAVIEARINSIEQQTRELIDSRLTADWGPSAWKKCIPGDIQDHVRQRIDQQIKQKPYEADQYETVLAKLEQCQFSDYAQIMMFNWDRFQDIFGTKPQLQQYFGAVTNARNALKHGRALNHGELATTEGALYWLEQCLNHAAAVDGDGEVDDAVPVLAGVEQRAN